MSAKSCIQSCCLQSLGLLKLGYLLRVALHYPSESCSLVMSLLVLRQHRMQDLRQLLLHASRDRDGHLPAGNKLDESSCLSATSSTSSSTSSSTTSSDSNVV